MTKSKFQRIYIQYVDETSDKVTLNFRSEESLKEHLEQYKISENELIYKSNKPPVNESLTVEMIKSAITYGKDDFAVV